MSAPLLPGNATALERAAAQALAQIERVPVPLRALWNPDTCPVDLLPYLAWTFSVDRWSSTWPESAKRAAIKAAYFIHAHKGTIGALRRAVEPLGYLVQVTEWWQTQPEGVPGTFNLELGSSERGITEEMYAALERLIDDAKPVSRHLTSLAISLESSFEAYTGVAVIDGQDTTIYPYSPRELAAAGLLYVAAVGQDVTDTTIYPLGWQDETALTRLATDGAQRLTEAGFLRIVEL